jgi:CBS domain containing-hemolysin-like protein
MSSSISAWILLTLCLALSFLLSGMEAGVFALSRLRIRRLAHAGRPSARLLHGFLENPENFLWTILVGNTLANFIILGWVIVKLHEWLAAQHVLIVVIFAACVFLFYALFDLLPKMLFRAHPNQLCLAMASVFRFVHLGLSPLVLLMQGASRIFLRGTRGTAFNGQLFGNREEMRAVMQETAVSLTSDERVMINRVLDLQNITVRQVATPLARAVTVEAQTPIREALALARENTFSRLPVWENRDGRRRVAGLLTLDTLLFEGGLELEKPAAAHLSPALFVNENMRLEIAFRLMQRAGHRLAIVLDRNRDEIGIVTLEDILKVMFGEVKL